ncbi:PREDICTED: uncharacterized protein LOC109339708 [Lupinus angustifolius]|uniref:uncharacterized protein LOC109339708 n=1 Tax=Lupinus angustifolius TaxID=3871 RepID=UPI00092E50B9|nr:PREDICTED: uncharacterized protein LOC109339708 [Lupinus angustifolius]
MIATLTSNRANKFVLGTEIPHRFLNDDERLINKVSSAYLRWEEQDQAIFSWILNSLSVSLQPRVVGCQHSWQLWEELHSLCSLQTKARSRQLRSQLRSITQDSLSISEYIRKIKNLVDALVFIGAPISTSEHIDYVLDGLNEEFQPVVTSIETKDDLPTLHSSESFLLTFEARMEKNKSKVLADALSANVAAAPSLSSSSGPHSMQSVPSSSQFHDSGHFSPMRPNFANGGYRGFRGGRRGGRFRGGRIYHRHSQLYCEFCNRHGHEVSNCYYAPLGYNSLSHILPGSGAPTRPSGLRPQNTLHFSNGPMKHSAHYNSPYADHYYSSSHLYPHASYFPPTAAHYSFGPPPSSSLLGPGPASSQYAFPPSSQEQYHHHSPYTPYAMTANAPLSTQSLPPNILNPGSNTLLLKGNLTKDGLYVFHDIVPSYVPSCSIASDLNKSSVSSSSHTLCKAHKLHAPLSTSVYHNAFELVFVDLWGPASVHSYSGFRYYFTIVDAHSRFTWLFLLKQKSETLSLFQYFVNLVKTQFGTTIKAVQSDFGGEFRPFTTYLGIPTHTLQQRSPFQVLFGDIPDYKFFKVFGCSCYPLLRSYNKNKLEPRSTECVFLVYSPNHKGYKCLSRHGKIYISKDVVFNEHSFPFVHNPGFGDNDLPTTTSTSLSQSFIPLNVFNTPTSVDPESSGGPLSSSSGLINLSPGPISLPNFTSGSSGAISSYSSVNVKSALADPVWKQAMQEEYNALIALGTWSLVPLPPNKQDIGCKWVFKVKENPDGSVLKYKARLVVKGFHQKLGIDYTETFSLVVKPITIRILLTLAVTYQWPLEQLDINNAFLNDILDEDVYMQQPSGFQHSDKSLVGKLHKAIYGLKQAPRQWFHKLKATLITLGFFVSKCDNSLFIHTSTKTQIFVLVYVDDIIVTGSSQPLVHKVIKDLSASFALKQLGKLDYFLVKRILRYLQGTLSFGLFIQQATSSVPLTISTFCDADWASDIDDRKSTSGACLFLVPISLPGGPRSRIPFPDLVQRHSTGV